MAQLHKLRLRGFYSLGKTAHQDEKQLQTLTFKTLENSDVNMEENVDSIIGPTGTVRGVKNLVRKNRTRYNGLSAPILEECVEEEELRQTLDAITEDVDDSGISCQSSECEDGPVLSPRSSTSESVISTCQTNYQQSVLKEDACKTQDSSKNVDEDDQSSNSIVIYTTSMGGVRETIEECRYVLKIFYNLGLKVDERDVYMSKSYHAELESAIGKPITLPQVFINEKHLGSKEEIERLNETGELRDILHEFERHNGANVCETCAGFTYINCPSCNGSGTSRKMRFQREINVLRCTTCNENGLLRCPTCCKT